MTEKKDISLSDSEIPQSAIAKPEDQVRIRTDRFRSIYINNLQIVFSTWDMAINFGEIVGEKDGKPIIEETVQIKMTREIGKFLSIVLSNGIAEFEKQSGHKIVILGTLSDKNAQKSSGSPEEKLVIKGTNQPLNTD